VTISAPRIFDLDEVNRPLSERGIVPAGPTAPWHLHPTALGRPRVRAKRRKAGFAVVGAAVAIAAGLTVRGLRARKRSGLGGLLERLEDAL
jgi:hypothetical protein